MPGCLPGMIEVRAVRGNLGLLQQITVRGHAGLAEAGNDILCAAVSVLMENLEQSLELLLQAANQGRKEKGYQSIELATKDMNEQSGLLMASTLLGLQALAVQYPERIHLQDNGILDS